MQLRVLILFVCAFIAFAECNKSVPAYKEYKDYKIYSVFARSKEQLKAIKNLSKNSSYNFLLLSRRYAEPSRVLVSPQNALQFLKALNDGNIHFVVVTDDVSKGILKQRAETSKRPRNDLRLNVLENFYKHFEINEHLDLLATLFPTRAYVKTFGNSYERRPLKIITITNGDGRPKKKVIFIDAGMHAREWIAPSMALFIIDQLLDNYTENAELLQEYDWVIMPVVNADGYEYTHSVDRFWRKTRKPHSTSDCVGTDLNRNFDFEWDMKDGGSDEPCDETFRGEKPFSDPESRIVADIIRSYKERMKMYLTLHAYGNLILLPWGHTADFPDNYDEMMDVADAGAMAIVQETGSTYTYGNTHAVIYPTSGDSADYAAGVMDIPVCMAMELPAGGFSGFDPPVRQIHDIVSETWIGIKAMAMEVVENY